MQYNIRRCVTVKIKTIVGVKEKRQSHNQVIFLEKSEYGLIQKICEPST
jgi:hypothetical protein